METRILYILLFIGAVVPFAGSRIHAQSFYPLEVGNRWVYSDTTWGIGGGGARETTSVSIVRDTVMSNGFLYHMLSGHEAVSGVFVRADSNTVYYYNHFQSIDVPFFKLNANVNEQWNVNLGPFFTVRLVARFVDNVFGSPRTFLRFVLDGLAVTDVWLAEGFGPVVVWDQYDPPGSTNTWRTLVGAVISDTTYGTLVSVSQENGSPSRFELAQNYPNPFNPITTVRFTIPRKMFVSLRVYDMLGRDIATLVTDETGAGTHSVRWNSTNVAGGVYLYRLATQEYVETKRMLLLR